MVEIDGEHGQKWHQFKQNFLEGNKETKAQFVLNMDKDNEKLMYWSNKKGFESEVSDHYQTGFDRIERRLIRKQIKDHGEGIFLRSRKILPFELLLIESLGGRDIFTNIFDKELSLCTQDTLVYQWIDAAKAPMQQKPSDFLKYTNSTREFTEKYGTELSNQKAAMTGKKEKVMASIFANELEEILWSVTPLILANEELRSHFPEPLLDDIELYKFTVTCDLMKTPVLTPEDLSVVEVQEEQIDPSEVEKHPNYEEEIDPSEVQDRPNYEEESDDNDKYEEFKERS